LSDFGHIIQFIEKEEIAGMYLVLKIIGGLKNLPYSAFVPPSKLRLGNDFAIMEQRGYRNFITVNSNINQPLKKSFSGASRIPVSE